MRHWLITSTTYGTWLPGDARGSVTSVRDFRPSDRQSSTRVEHDGYGQAWEPAIPKLAQSAATLMNRPPVWLNQQQAELLAESFQASAAYRGWTLHAAAVMANHFHLVVSASPEVRSEKLLRDFKAYASRSLNHQYGKEGAENWWTSGGSRRPLHGERALRSAIEYVLMRQSRPLCIWSPTSTE